MILILWQFIISVFVSTIFYYFTKFHTKLVIGCHHNHIVSNILLVLYKTDVSNFITLQPAKNKYLYKQYIIF